MIVVCNFLDFRYVHSKIHSWYDDVSVVMNFKTKCEVAKTQNDLIDLTDIRSIDTTLFNTSTGI